MIPSPAAALPPHALVTVGTSLGIPLVALCVAGLVIIRYRAIRRWRAAKALGRTLTILLAVAAAMLAATEAIRVSVPDKLQQNPMAHEIGLVLDAEELSEISTERMLAIDIRDGPERQREHTPESVHIEVEEIDTGLIYHGPRQEIVELGALRAATLFRERRGRTDRVVVFCYGGGTAVRVARALREMGVPAQALRHGWNGVKEVLSVRSGNSRNELRNRIIAPEVARRWTDEGRAAVVEVSRDDLTDWMRMDPGEVWSGLEAKAGQLPILLAPEEPWLMLLAASRLREEGHAPLAWVNADLGEEGSLKGALAAAGRDLDDAAGEIWWLLLVISAILWSSFLYRRQLRMHLLRRSGDAAARAALIGQVAVVLVLNELARGADAWSGANIGFLVDFSRSSMPIVVAGGVWFQLAQPRPQRLARFAAALRRRLSSDAPARPPRWVLRWYHPLCGIAVGASMAFLPHTTVYSMAILLWLVPVAEEALVAWAAWRLAREQDDAAAAKYLLAAAGQRVDEAESHLRVRTFSPGRPGCAEVIDGGGSRPYGLFTGREMKSPSSENCPSEGNSPPGALTEAVISSFRAAALLERDLEVDWRLASPAGAPRMCAVRLLEEPSESRGDVAWQLHRQIMAFPVDLRRTVRSSEPVLSARRYEEAVAQPTPLTFGCLAARVEPGGGAGMASRRLGVRPRYRFVVRLGARIYDIVGERAPRFWSRLVLRTTTRAFLYRAAHSALTRHLPASLKRISTLSRRPVPSERELERLMADYVTTGAQFPEQISLAAAVANLEAGDPGERPADDRIAAEEALEPRRGSMLTFEDGSPAPYELMPVTGRLARGPLALPMLPGVDTVSSAGAAEDWVTLRSFAERMRSWTRTLHIAETARLGLALARFGEKLGIREDMFYLSRSEALAALRHVAPDRDRAAERRRLLDLLRHIEMPVELSVEDLEALEPLQPKSVARVVDDGEALVRGVAVAGRFPVRGVVHIIGRDPVPAARQTVAVVPRLPPDMVPGCVGVGAVVAEQGGMLSHAAILARELDVPAILGASGATRRLRDRDRVILEADGRIRPARGPAQESPAPGDPLWLPLAGAQRRELAGGKAAMLSRLIADGVCVPEGVVLTAEAFRQAMRHLGVATPMAGETGEAPAALAAGDLPLALTDALAEIWAFLVEAGAAGEVIVRSSAVVEDHGTHSFAGLFRSVADVRDLDALVRAVRRCWSSAWAPELSGYANRLGIRAELAMGLVIQRQISGEVGGVLFTREPGTGKGDGGRMLCELSTRGPGAVAGGTVRPTRLVLTGPEDWVVTETGDDAFELDAALVSRLFETAATVEAVVRGPADVEWLWERGTLWVLQGRGAGRV